MNEFFDNVTIFFASLTETETIILVIAGILLFAIGLIIGYILQRRSTKRYQKELLLMRSERDEYARRATRLQDENKKIAKELEAVSRDKVAALDRIQALDAALREAENLHATLRQRNEELTATNQSYAATIESLNDQVIGLKTQNERLLEDARNTTAASSGSVAGAGGIDEGAKGSDPNLGAYLNAFEARFQHLEDRLLTLTEENATLRATAGYRAPDYAPEERFDDVPVTVVPQPIPPPVATNAAGEPLVIRADTTEPGIRKGSHGEVDVVVTTTPSVQVPVAAEYDEVLSDDLTRIKNIGPFLQQKLNEVDIYKYEQIAGWTEADILTYTELIGYVPGVIQRDDWVGQAQRLTTDSDEVATVPGEETGTFGTHHTIAHAHIDSATEASPAAAAPVPDIAEAAAATAFPAEDGAKHPLVDQSKLRIVEGIGPGIEALLHDAGVTTLSVLADTEPDRLREILDAGGPRFKSHNPKTWPIQAGLAADGKIVELQAWQKELKGGK